jgi:hypothetical protein
MGSFGAVLSKAWELPTLESHGRHPTESEIQIAFIRWFRRTFPGVLIFAIPNGGKRGKSVALRLKCEGMVAGVSDLCIPAFYTYLELKKSDGGKGATKHQKEFISYVRSVGYTAEVCNGLDEAKDLAIRVAAKHGVTRANG